MKVLFFYKYNYIEPIGLMYLSSALKLAGHETFFYDILLDGDVCGFVGRLRPEIIAYSIVTGTHHQYARLNRRLKERFSFFAVFGGPHATFFPDFINEPGVDAVCIGEGEDALAELATGLERNQDITGIANMWVKLGDTIFKNDVRPLDRNIDRLAFPDRALVYSYDAYRKRSNKYVTSSRGCPYNCTYCFNHSLKKLYRGKGLFCRKRSIGNVIGELEGLKRAASVKRVQFFDDVFILDRQWVLDFCKEYRERIALPFICYARVNLLDEEIVAALKSAGVVTITFAIETGSSHLRNQVLKRRISERSILKAAELMHRYTINFFTQNMVGLPGETVADALRTVTLNARCRPSYANASLFQPYPGLELTDYAVSRGYYRRDHEIVHDSFYKTSVLDLESKRELTNLARLFSLAAAWPRMLPLIRLLIKLPGGPLFSAVWHITRGYGYLFRIKWIDTADVFSPYAERLMRRLRACRHSKPGRRMPCRTQRKEDS